MIDSLQSAKRASPPEKAPGAHHPVIATPSPDMCPDKQRVLQQALSDSYSCGWVHDLMEKEGVK